MHAKFYHHILRDIFRRFDFAPCGKMFQKTAVVLNCARGISFFNFKILKIGLHAFWNGHVYILRHCWLKRYFLAILVSDLPASGGCSFTKGGFFMDLQSAPALTSQEQEEIEYFLSAKGLPLQLNVTFGDVVLPEQYSAVTSRSHIRDFSTLLVPGFEIARPLVSANMESVSGTTLITEIEKLGGIGIPPQTLPPKALLKILEQVAQEDCAFRTNCLTVRTEHTIAQVRALAEEHGI